MAVNRAQGVAVQTPAPELTVRDLIGQADIWIAREREMISQVLALREQVLRAPKGLPIISTRELWNLSNALDEWLGRLLIKEHRSSAR